VRRATPVALADPRAPSGSAVPPPLPKLAPAAERNPPDWIQDIRRKYTLRLTDWVTQAWAVTIAPRRFMEEWAAGQRETLNPLRYFAVGTTFSYFADRGSRRVLHIPNPPQSGFIAWMYTHFGITLMVLMFGVVMHGVLRLRSRAPLRSTLAALVFASSGPGTFATLFAWVGTCALYLARGSAPMLVTGGVTWPWAVLICSYLSFAWTVATLAAVHRVRWWWPLLSLVILFMALIVVGVVVGLIYRVVKG
jgi:hypothetical protein